MIKRYLEYVREDKEQRELSTDVLKQKKNQYLQTWDIFLVDSEEEEKQVGKESNLSADVKTFRKKY